MLAERSARLEHVPAQSQSSDAMGQDSCEGYAIVTPGTRRRPLGGASLSQRVNADVAFGVL
jgi:hypothetical protein